MSVKYRTTTKKEDILKAIVNTFNDVNKAYTEEKTDYNYGRYAAMIDLLRKVEIYEIKK